MKTACDHSVGYDPWTDDRYQIVYASETINLATIEEFDFCPDCGKSLVEFWNLNRA